MEVHGQFLFIWGGLPLKAEYQEKGTLSIKGLLGNLVISGAISPLIWLISIVTPIITPFYNYP